MAEEIQIETLQQRADSDVETEMPCKTSPCIIEIQDSTTECEDEVRPSLLQKEEKSFISGLHSFMKDRGSPIERIPHLGFKQINLWMIYKAVEKLGGYDSVTARRLWKKVYDELGGSPGSTSAATCTRRHYERLVLPFERHLKGEDDKPLPPSKQRKPYKRNLDGKINKVDRRGKDTQSDYVAESGPDNACQSQAQLHSHSVWSTASDRPDCPNQVATNLCSSNYKCPHLLSVPATSPWTAHIASAMGEVISPLEKKKRMAQANLNLSQSPQGEDKERPSVIHCSQSPAWASSSQGCNLSDGSPLPVSSSSSRSPSPYSISSEDGHRGNEDKPGSSSELCVKCSSTLCSPEDKSSCRHVSKHPAGQNEDGRMNASSHSRETVTRNDQMHNFAWKAIHKGDVKNFTYPFYPAFNVKSDWVPAPTSSFTKVIPKNVQLPRPSPIRPVFKTQPNRLMYQNESLACTKKLKNTTPLHYQGDKREKSRTMLQKVPPPQPTSNSLPASCVLTSYDKSGRDPHHHFPFLPAFLPNRMRLPPSQLMYHHYPVSPSLSGFTGHDACLYPHPIPLLSEQTRYILPVRNPLYPNTHH